MITSPMRKLTRIAYCFSLLQQHLGVEGAVVTRIVKQLEAEGIVTRCADPQDNRFTLVELTPETRHFNTTDKAIKFKENLGEQLTKGLSKEEKTQLRHLIKRVRENVKALGGSSSYDT
jgi:DNA-binding MarR family transcriptional regulator